MTENDVLAALIAAVTVIKLTTIGLKHRATQRAAIRKTIASSPAPTTKDPS